MNDVKLDPTATSPPKGAASSLAVTSSAPQPEKSKPSEKSITASNNQEVENKEKTQQAESVRVTKESQDLQREKVQEAVAQLNDYIQSVQRDLEFNIDKESGRMVVSVLDTSTKEIIRQIPDEMALKLARNLQNEEPISLLNTKA